MATMVAINNRTVFPGLVPIIPIIPIISIISTISIISIDMNHSTSRNSNCLLLIWRNEEGREMGDSEVSIVG